MTMVGCPQSSLGPALTTITAIDAPDGGIWAKLTDTLGECRLRRTHRSAVSDWSSYLTAARGIVRRCGEAGA